MKLKAVILDMDGTFIDSKLSFTAMKAEIGMPVDSDIVDYLTEKRHDEKFIQKALTAIHRHEKVGAQNSTIIRDFLDFKNFLEEHNIPHGVLTRNSKHIMDETLNMHKLNFEFAFSRDCCTPKPSPEGLLIMAKNWDIDPQEIAYIGDYEFDIKTARNAGMKAGAILNEVNQHLKEISDFSFINYAEIKDFFE